MTCGPSSILSGSAIAGGVDMPAFMTSLQDGLRKMEVQFRSSCSALTTWERTNVCFTAHPVPV